MHSAWFSCICKQVSGLTEIHLEKCLRFFCSRTFSDRGAPPAGLQLPLHLLQAVLEWRRGRAPSSRTGSRRIHPAQQVGPGLYHAQTCSALSHDQNRVSYKLFVSICDALLVLLINPFTIFDQVFQLSLVFDLTEPKLIFKAKNFKSKCSLLESSNIHSHHFFWF